jgi:crotonobetainyl-CoA:carnitine CoA-transferase CaiB-like acyl-CoA transferase
MQPLTGTRVLEIGSFITAPYAAMMLADLGAEIIKVERPGAGDPFRSFKGGTYSPHFRGYNRSKKSITLNLMKPEGRRVVEQLAQDTDVVLENFRPGYMDEIGLGYEALAKTNPRLIYCSITGFGADGPYRARPSYDTVGQGLSGVLSLYVDAGNSRLTGTAISDSVTGMYACYAVLGGLLLRERTGRGVRVETNMLATTMSFIEMWFTERALTGGNPGPFRKSEVNQSFALRCSDGKLVAIHLSSPPKFWEGLVAATGSAEFANDPRFKDRMSRVEKYEELRSELSAIFSKHPRSYWLTKLEENDVPFAPVYNLEEAENDPQVQFLGLLRDVVHPVEGPTRVLGRPVWYDGDRGTEALFAPPQVGEHSAEILASLNYSAEAIEQFRAQKII